MPTRVLLAHPNLGAFLGFDAHELHWSRLNPDGLDHAVTFKDIDQTRGFLTELHQRGLADFYVLFVEVASYERHASLGTCVKAGIPMWDVPVSGSC
jgi:hypothetical protein